MTTLTPDTSPAEIDALAAQVASGLTTLSQSDVRDGLLEHRAALRYVDGTAETDLETGSGDPRTAYDVVPIEWVRFSTDTATGETTITQGTGFGTGPATLVASISPMGRSRISR